MREKLSHLMVIMSSKGKLKVKKSLALEQFVKTLIQKGVCEIKELVDFESQKLNPQLVTDILNFVEQQVEGSKYKGSVVKKDIAKEILTTCFALNEDEIGHIESMIQHAVDNKLVKDSRFFSVAKNICFGLLGK